MTEIDAKRPVPNATPLEPYGALLDALGDFDARSSSDRLDLKNVGKALLKNEAGWRVDTASNASQEAQKGQNGTANPSSSPEEKGRLGRNCRYPVARTPFFVRA